MFHFNSYISVFTITLNAPLPSGSMTYTPLCFLPRFRTSAQFLGTTSKTQHILSNDLYAKIHLPKTLNFLPLEPELELEVGIAPEVGLEPELEFEPELELEPELEPELEFSLG